jgi:hypothetical protein
MGGDAKGAFERPEIADLAGSFSLTHAPPGIVIWNHDGTGRVAMGTKYRCYLLDVKISP